MQAAAKCCERMWNCVWSGINISFFFKKKKGNLNLDFVFILLYLSLSFWNIFDLLPFPGNELKFFFFNL